MSLFRFIAIPTHEARAYRRGEADAYGMKPERKTSDGSGVPCRHCLRNVAAGEDYLVLAYRPFPALQPYAETGPIFLHARECDRATETDVLPPMFRATPDYILRGYSAEDRIVYGTGGVVPTHLICGRAHELLEREDVAYVHMRSARNNCYQLRIERA
ncbi:DUF1203 domain-containing protein [Aquamicrobium sp. LC103]|uniref:DUF1203 domain-containing protein n=1 Tax=Aquamicrobium sp. LC103 TaxID=1120658 RepID=UPI00063ED33B|nr:DUF1203 domain-containing protein [Aquamicrobium sp. LC103]TKT76715.1 DUF1203 domain-containing protein [Aquamicrobium sp. LC103]